MSRRFLSIGECMVEMAAVGDGRFHLGFAGDTFNTAWHVRRELGADWAVEYFTALGDDDISMRMLAFMTTEGIGTERILRLKGRAPGLYLIELRDGERSFSYWRGQSAARQLADDADRLRHATADADAIYVSGISFAILADQARRNLLAALATAKARGAMIAFDSNIRLRLWENETTLRETLRQASKVTTLALPTVPDELDLFGESDANAVADRYRADGVEEIVVKAGASPALLASGGTRQFVAAESVTKIIDTTGAGDSFNGGYIAARLKGETPSSAARRAHQIAARVIQNYGALA